MTKYIVIQTHGAHVLGSYGPFNTKGEAQAFALEHTSKDCPMLVTVLNSPAT